MVTTISDEKFKAFFLDRFGKDAEADEHDHGYADEWVQRLNAGVLHGNKNSVAWNVADYETRAALRKHYPELCPSESE